MPALAIKSRFRHLRYFALLFRSELLFGGAARRRYFVNRLIDRVGMRFGLFVIPEFFFTTLYALGCLLGSRDWRVRRWFWATARLENKMRLRAWAGKKDCPKIIVLGTGSIGDVLQITPVLRALREKFPMAEIALLHRSLTARKILQGNPHINFVIQEADFYAFNQIKSAVKTEGVADLVVEIQSVTYLVTYTRAPKALCHPDFDWVMPDDFFVKAEAALELWREPSRLQLDPQTKSVWPDKWRGWHFLDVLGATGNVPIDKNSDLDFFIDVEARDDWTYNVPGQKYITVQNGVDADVMNWSRATGQYPTKLLPLATWTKIVSQLRAQGVCVVQLGGSDDAQIDGVSFDLRGKTTLSEAALLLQNAICHVGTEGGLVHLSRAVLGKSIVLFGPTAVDFFGYPGNVNLSASDCTGCWRNKRDWHIYCPRGFAEAACMNAFTPEMIVKEVLDLTGNVQETGTTRKEGNP